jgi:hypothetical protein
MKIKEKTNIIFKWGLKIEPLVAMQESRIYKVVFCFFFRVQVFSPGSLLFHILI